MKMSASASRGEGLTPQLQADLADFEAVLKEYKIDLNPSRFIPLTSKEYEDSMQVFEEFLKYQDGVGLDSGNNPPMEELDNVQPMEEDVTSFDNRVPAPGCSVSEMRDLYLADMDVEMETFMELNLEPVSSSDLDLNKLELDDLFFKGANESSPPNEKPVLIAEEPQLPSSEPRHTDGNVHQYGRPPVLTAQVTPNDLDLKDKDDISVNIMYNPIPTEDMPTDTEDSPSNTDDIPTDTDDISTEPEDSSTDNEDILTNPKYISTYPWDTLSPVDPGSFKKPDLYTINTWMLNREKERRKKLKNKAKKTVTTPSTTTRSSGTTSHPRRRLFFENRKESLPSIPESGTGSQIQTNATEKTSLDATDKEKAKETEQACAIKKKQTSGIPRRRCGTQLRQT